MDVASSGEEALRQVEDVAARPPAARLDDHQDAERTVHHRPLARCGGFGTREWAAGKECRCERMICGHEGDSTAGGGLILNESETHRRSPRGQIDAVSSSVVARPGTRSRSPGGEPCGAACSRARAMFIEVFVLPGDGDQVIARPDAPAGVLTQPHPGLGVESEEFLPGVGQGRRRARGTTRPVSPTITAESPTSVTTQGMPQAIASPTAEWKGLADRRRGGKVEAGLDPGDVAAWPEQVAAIAQPERLDGRGQRGVPLVDPVAAEQEVDPREAAPEQRRGPEEVGVILQRRRTAPPDPMSGTSGPTPSSLRTSTRAAGSGR